MNSFADFTVDAPDLEKTEVTYRELWTIIERPDIDENALVHAVRAWDALRRRLGTWRSVTYIRFEQNLKSQAAKAAREQLDSVWPSITEWETITKRHLLEHPQRALLERTFGTTAFALWEMDLGTFAASIKDDLVKESTLSGRYSELVGSALVELDGDEVPLSRLHGQFDVPDRERRTSAQQTYWSWFADNGDAIDTLFDQLVKVRDGIARELGCKDFVELGYRRMQRVDYDRDDVVRVRRTVREKVVPLVARVRAEQARRHGADRLTYIDELVFDPAGDPRPLGTTEEKTAAASEMFHAMHPDLGRFFDVMRERELLDLDARAGKSGGGFCDILLEEKLPFIFANFNGSKGDVTVFTHEAGHAFQMWCSADNVPSDYVIATYESCEIHSMSLEFLTYPYMDRFFGEDAERFRTGHLFDRIAFLPYGCAIDEFQHWIYENPDATPAARRAEWKRLEGEYLPWRDYGDLPHAPDGGFWHRQGHLFAVPFYYIDYVLAGMCALQYWVRFEDNADEALESYVALCRRGGSLPFQELARSAGLRSPFEHGCIDEALRRIARRLGVD